MSAPTVKPSSVADRWNEPWTLDCTRPIDDTEATEVSLDIQVTCGETSFVLPSVYVPVTVNCFEPPFEIVVSPGESASETSAAVEMFTGAVPLRPLTVPVTVTKPADTPVRTPEESMVARPVLLEAHVAPDRTCVVES